MPPRKKKVREWEEEFYGFRQPVRTPEEYRLRAMAYFRRCFSGNQRVKMNGLRLALGLYDDEKWKALRKDETFSEIVGWSHLVVAEGYEELLETRAAAGKFGLRQHGWTEDAPRSQQGELPNVQFTFKLSEGDSKPKQIEATVTDVKGDD